MDEIETRSKSKQKNIIVEPRLKPIKYQTDELNFNKISKTSIAHRYSDIEFFSFEDNPLNKRGYKYKPCKPNTLFKSMLYSTTDLAPYTVRPSYFDKSPGIICDDTMLRVSGIVNGWRTIRTNVGVREGCWYMEFKIVQGNDNTSGGHVRIGMGRREASLEAPIGFDGYGYGLRDTTGQKITLSRPKPFMSQGFKSGDTLGLLISLPTLKEHQKSLEFDISTNEFNENGNLVRDQIPIKYKNSLYFEQFEYTNTENMSQLLNPIKLFGETLEKSYDLINLPTIPHSQIKVYKNGEPMGVMFDELYLFLPLPGNLTQLQNSQYKNTDDGSLGYFPMISIYNNAVVQFNPGPKFDFKVDYGMDHVKPLSDRYDEWVVEQWLFDIIDEVESEYLDELEKSLIQPQDL